MTEVLDTEVLNADREHANLRRRTAPAQWGRGVAYVMLAVAASYGAWMWADENEKKMEPVAEAKDVKTVKLNRNFDEYAYEEPEPEPEPEPAAEPEVIVKTVYVEAKPPAIDKSAPRATQITGSSLTKAMAAANGANEGTTQVGGGSSSEGGQIRRASSSRGSGVSTSIAGRLDNVDYRLNRATHIGCSMETQIDTTLAGNASCLFEHDIYSSNGECKLFNQGDRMIGSYNTDSITQGVRRVDLIWEEVRGPGGFYAELMSPATSTLGTTGLAADVDNHWKERIGMALMISVLDIAVNEAVTRSSNTAGGDLFVAGARSSSSLAEEVLRNSINIKPTLFTGAGDRVGVVTVRDIVVPDARCNG